jgi:predicted PurR-regulated permease PerM
VTDKEFKVPFYAQATLIIIGLFALITILYIGRSIIVPFVFATIISILLSPAVNFFVRIKINRIIAIAITLLFTILVIASFSTLLIAQMSRFSESLPLLAEKFTEVLNQLITWASGYFDISTQKINIWIAETKDELINTSGSAIGKTIVSLGGVFVVIFIVPVYIFMILYYQPLLLDFIHKLAGVDHESKVSEMIIQTKTLIQRYLIGLFIEVIVISFLYSIGLLILGIEYAIILGVLGAFLNLIPYLGSIIAASMPMIIAFVNKPSPWFVLLVLGLYIFIQFIDNNFLVPKIVGSKVKLNALASIIAVIIFGTLWGISGMLLAIPLTAITKLVFDHIEPLKPWGFLLGDTMPPSTLLEIDPIINRIKKLKKII